MAYRCPRFFFFFLLFFFASEKSGHGLCCHTFFQWKKTKTKYRYHRPECLWGVLFKMATTTIVKKTIEELKEVLSRYLKQNVPRNEP